MPHIFELASTGRARCRGCNQPIAKAELRFGERLPNPFADGELTHWFHPLCAAYKRPEVMLESLPVAPDVADVALLEAAARGSTAQPRLQRIDGAERAPSSQARCRHCREPIEKGGWRIRLIFHEEGTFSPGGFIHLACGRAYFETDVPVEHLLHFSKALNADERDALVREL